MSTDIREFAVFKNHVVVTLRKVAQFFQKVAIKIVNCVNVSLENADVRARCLNKGEKLCVRVRK